MSKTSTLTKTVHSAMATATTSTTTSGVKLPSSFVPTFVNGHWRKPELSAMKRATLRKEVLMNGQQWPFDPPSKRHIERPMRGHRHERQKIIRQARIEENMKEMPKKLEQYYQAMKARRIVPTVLDVYLGRKVGTQTSPAQIAAAAKAAAMNKQPTNKK